MNMSNGTDPWWSTSRSKRLILRHIWARIHVSLITVSLRNTIGQYLSTLSSFQHCIHRVLKRWLVRRWSTPRQDLLMWWMPKTTTTQHWYVGKNSRRRWSKTLREKTWRGSGKHGSSPRKASSGDQWTRMVGAPLTALERLSLGQTQDMVSVTTTSTKGSKDHRHQRSQGPL